MIWIVLLLFLEALRRRVNDPLLDELLVLINDLVGVLLIECCLQAGERAWQLVDLAVPSFTTTFGRLSHISEVRIEPNELCLGVVVDGRLLEVFHLLASWYMPIDSPMI